MYKSDLPPRTVKVAQLLLALRFLSSPMFASASTPNVTWTSPISGAMYGPGDTITGQWTVSDGAQAVNAPSFRLCMTGDSDSGGSSGSDSDDGGEEGHDSDDTRSDDDGDDGSDGGDDGDDHGSHNGNQRRSDDDNCGETVWPSVQETSGSYSVSLAVPNITQESAYFLQMMDDFGSKMMSPTFSLSPTPQDAENSNSSASTSADASFPSSTTRSATSPSSPTDVADSPSSTSGSYPDLAAAHAPPPVTAFAIPLSIVGAILIAAIVLCILHWRKLKAERAQDSENLKSISQSDDLSRRSSLLSSVGGWHGDKYGFGGEQTMGWDGRYDSRRDSRYSMTTYGEPVMARPVSPFYPEHRSYSGRSRTGRREPERRYITRQPFPQDIYTVPHLPYSHGDMAPQPATAPAGLFRSSLCSPNLPPHYPIRASRENRYREQESDFNATVNHSLITDYLRPSPNIPTSLCPSTPSSGSPHARAVPGTSRHFTTVAEPQKLFVRSGTPGMEDELRRSNRHLDSQGSDVYDKVTRLLYPR